jgi:hypothetical protein
LSLKLLRPLKSFLRQAIQLFHRGDAARKRRRGLLAIGIAERDPCTLRFAKRFFVTVIDTQHIAIAVSRTSDSTLKRAVEPLIGGFIDPARTLVYFNGGSGILTIFRKSGRYESHRQKNSGQADLWNSHCNPSKQRKI